MQIKNCEGYNKKNKPNKSMIVLSITHKILIVILLVLSAKTDVVAFTHISQITSWWPEVAIAASLGVPGYAPANKYNYISLGYWGCNMGPVQAAQVWANPVGSFGTLKFGSTDN